MIASFRMYNATPRIAAAWRALFGRAFAELGLDIAIVDHAWPEPLESLWRDPALACGFMCGWPFARAQSPLQPIAVPVPAPARYAGEPRYRSDFLVREDSGWTRLEDAFGSRFGWMSANSQSGFNGPRAHLARFVSRERPALFRAVAGPLGTPARALQALREGEVDAVALDGYYLDLLRHDDPDRLNGIRAVGATDWAPMPLLVAAPDIPGRTVERLRAKLTQLHADPAWRPLLGAVLLERFAPPESARYAALEAMASEARERGYEAIR